MLCVVVQPLRAGEGEVPGDGGQVERAAGGPQPGLLSSSPTAATASSDNSTDSRIRNAAIAGDERGVRQHGTAAGDP